MIIILDRTEVQAHRVSAVRDPDVPLAELDAVMDLINKDNLPTNIVLHCHLLIITDKRAGTFRVFKDRYDLFRENIFPLSKMYGMLETYQLLFEEV